MGWDGTTLDDWHEIGQELQINMLKMSSHLGSALEFEYHVCCTSDFRSNGEFLIPWR